MFNPLNLLLKRHPSYIIRTFLIPLLVAVLKETQVITLNLEGDLLVALLEEICRIAPGVRAEYGLAFHRARVERRRVHPAKHHCTGVPQLAEKLSDGRAIGQQPHPGVDRPRQGIPVCGQGLAQRLPV